MAHGYCQYGRNFVKGTETRGDIEYNWSLYSAASQITNDKSVTLAMTKPARPLSLAGSTNFDMRNNVKPMDPCYMVPAAGCHGCNSMDPRNRVSSYVQNAKLSYHLGHY